jgi:hypothetical protein
MRPGSVAGRSPTLDDELGLVQRLEDLAIEKHVAQARIERGSARLSSTGHRSDAYARLKLRPFLFDAR